ncbi:TPA: MurR/RpiR family transcriptional regulator [Streptococcus suis]
MLEKLVAKHQKSFGDLDRQIVKYMLNNKEALRDLSITDLADATYTSKSTVLRLVKKLGFSGYSEFKYNLRMARASSAENSGGGGRCCFYSGNGYLTYLGDYGAGRLVGHH